MSEKDLKNGQDVVHKAPQTSGGAVDASSSIQDRYGMGAYQQAMSGGQDPMSSMLRQQVIESHRGVNEMPGASLPSGNQEMQRYLAEQEAWANMVVPELLHPEQAASPLPPEANPYFNTLNPEADELAAMQKQAQGTTWTEGWLGNTKAEHKYVPKGIEARNQEALEADPEAAQMTDKVTYGTDGKSLFGGVSTGDKQGDTSASTTQIGAKVEREKASVSLGGMREHKSGGVKDKRTWGVGLDSDGNLTGELGHDNVTAKAGVNFAKDGTIEEVSGGGSYKTKGGTTFGGSAKVDPLTIAVTGNTVSWNAGVSGDISAGKGQAKGALNAGAEKNQTRTFNSPKEAKDFAKSLHRQPQDNRELDFTTLEPGEAASFVMEMSGGGKGNIGIVGGNAKLEHSEKFNVKKTDETTLDVTIENLGSLKGGLSASSGLPEVGAGVEGRSQSDMHLKVDTTSPEALAALQAVMNGEQLPMDAEIPGLKFGALDLDSLCTNGSMDLVVAKLYQEECQGEGAYRMFDTGEHGELDGSSTKESESGYFGWLSSLFGYDRSGKEGSYEDSAHVFKPELVQGEGGQHIQMTQQFSFQQREISRHLHDQVTPRVDLEGISDAQLPDKDAPGMKDTANWVLETVIDQEGTQAVIDAIQSGDSDLEWDAIRELPWIRKELGEGLSDEEAIVKLAAQGEDAAEGMRDMAGEEHVERYLTQKGSDTWVGKKANQLLDQRFQQAISDARGGAPDALHALLDAESARGSRLVQEAERGTHGVPQSLVDEESGRVMQRLLDGYAALGVDFDVDSLAGE